MPLATRPGARRPVAANTVPDPGRCGPPGRTRQGKGSVMAPRAATDLRAPIRHSRCRLATQPGAALESCAPYSIWKTAEWTFGTWLAAVDAHPGGDAPDPWRPERAARLQSGRRIPGAQAVPCIHVRAGRWLSGCVLWCHGRIRCSRGSGAMPRPERVARLQQGLAGSGSTAAAGGVTRAPAGKTAEWTRTPGFSLCCYHVNPRTYRTASVFGGGP
jgi:hypothetical protein